jgi:phosphoglycolate phosphatase
VGDTVHDYEVAEAVGAVCMLYSGGHETKKRLAKCGCPVFDDMRDLPGLILGIC